MSIIAFCECLSRKDNVIKNSNFNKHENNLQGTYFSKFY